MIRKSKKIQVIVALFIAAFISSTGAYAEAPPSTVSRAEYEQLKRELQEMKQQLLAIKSQSVPAKQTTAPAAAQPVSASNDALKKEVEEVKSGLEDLRPGSEKFLLAGDASASFAAPRHGNSSFNATFSPVFMWQPAKDLFFEGEVELELEDGATKANLEYAQIAYSLNDYMTIGAGKFLSPLNTFVERYEPKWINKLPDTPLAVYDAILPESEVGAQIRGGVPIGDSKFVYALYVSNGPQLNAGPDDAGSLTFDNFQDNNHGKAFGGRLGFLPISDLELGYGIETAQASTSDNSIRNADVLIQSMDFDYGHDFPEISGRINLRGQYAWTHIGSETYSIDNQDLAFSNNRDGGYVQASYRPTRLQDLKDFEFVTRYDRVNYPDGAPGVNDEQRVTLGVDYWLEAKTALKLAYEIDDQKTEPNNNVFLTELAMGF